MLVVCWDSAPDVVAHLPPLQPVERLAASILESSGKDDRLEMCDQAVMYFLAVTAVGKYPPKLMEEWSGRRG